MGTRLRLLAPLLALALIGCDVLTGPSSITEAQLTGTWTLTSLQPSGLGSQATPAGVVYSLTLTDGAIATRTDCNVCTGRYTLTGRMLSTGTALACTRAACGTAAFESAYTTILGGESQVAVSAGALTLTSARGTLRFTR